MNHAQLTGWGAVEEVMKTNRFVVAGLAGLLAVTSLLAQTPVAPDPASPTPPPTDAASRKALHRQKMMQKYDTNGDGKLDANEKAAMRADMKAKRKAMRAGTAEPVAQPTPVK